MTSAVPSRKKGHFGLNREAEMAALRACFGLYAVIIAIFYVVMLPVSRAEHASSPAPAPAPTSDGTAIDQGIAYILMLLALALTYIIH
ncbi:arabinogalactan peptide 22-like isoform X2 [Cucurbita maxima]|uniref:Arabinogalactan peptide 22-like isoform X2 n=1 Tax=Cucurbita maxima TaxID=3661 RepID=A0A6J1HT15_CUCMA|nr:arabinogalactan peptide 22-like isoform X2 [Cucurbita maxima]